MTFCAVRCFNSLHHYAFVTEKRNILLVLAILYFNIRDAECSPVLITAKRSKKVSSIFARCFFFIDFDRFILCICLLLLRMIRSENSFNDEMNKMKKGFQQLHAYSLLYSRYVYVHSMHLSIHLHDHTQAPFASIANVLGLWFVCSFRFNAKRIILRSLPNDR